MQESIQKEKKAPAIPVIALIAAGLTVVLVLTLTPWNIIPTQVTEDVTVLAVTEYGCVGESALGISVVVSECSAQVGDVVSATFNVPAMEINGYYDSVKAKLAMVEP
ncbi:hypothetical protein C6988_06770 [Nitrosopumilus sp. b1]|uniref:hypothetical protein n=1 Tax=Nitrosopumilus sp. b1 TaxID=2109907 RepID=UPI0015F691B6|nr:hypothetical protein [Nitrosopumilus sp. b1]KAF6242871.1 hypothetical protein C6988_06770 [Nitrosopumilus sp. b1]